ncbi:hypothetical protein SLA2020_074670 [Shorea laevis]
MIKGIQGHGYHDELVVPIIKNTALEGELREFLTDMIRVFLKTRAVLVRNHGVFIWGDSWISAKTQCCILLNIEGTMTPISFVTDILFAYVHDSIGEHLASTYDTEETQRDIILLCSQGEDIEGKGTKGEIAFWYFKIKDDLVQGVASALPMPPDYVGKDLLIACLVANVEAMIRADRDVIALKRLQVSNLKIKSSVQISNYRNKNEAQSYFEILRTMGIERPSDILYVINTLQEAVAARSAGNVLLVPNIL